jgi:hypothetical protein
MKSTANEGKEEKSTTFAAPDETGLERQLWDWQLAHPQAIVTKKHPIESIHEMRKPVTEFAKMHARNSVSVRIDYIE